MKDLIEQAKILKKYSEKTLNIPLHYIVFVGTVFLMFQHQYIEYIDINSWVPDGLKQGVLGVLGLIYANYLNIVIGLVALVLIISLLFSYTSLFNRVFPDDEDYDDDTTVTWNPITAIKRVLKILESLSTQYFTYYLALLVLFNEHNFSENLVSFKSAVVNNELITSGYLAQSTLLAIYLLIFINIVATVLALIRALFLIKIPRNHYVFDEKDLELYTKINSYKMKNTNELIILKSKFFEKKVWLLVEVEALKTEAKAVSIADGVSHVLVPVLTGKHKYTVLDDADNLEDIKYHFDQLEKEDEE